MLSKVGRILFAFSGLAFVILAVCRLIYGGWHPSFWVPLVLTVAFFVGGVVKDWRALREITGMRSTKYGMNMGALILTALVGLVCVNFLADRYNKKFDWTAEKLNSLSEQSVKAAKALNADTELVLLYGRQSGGGDDPANSPEQVEKHVKILADMYEGVTPKIKFTAYNALTRPDLAQKFEYNFGPYAFFATQGERKVKIDPATEESVTRALLRLERDKKKTIYFTKGHGEHLLDQKDEVGLSTLKDDLSVTYDLKTFALFETKNVVPDDAAAVAIIGPNQQFLDDEIKALKDYLARGGHLLIALDPGTKQNLAGLVRSIGIDFTNEYVFDGRSRALKAAPQLVLGTTFVAGNAQGGEITRSIRQDGQAFTLFELASHLRKAADKPAGITVEPLISTDVQTGSVAELKNDMVIKANGPHIIAMTAKGHYAAAASVTPPPTADAGKEFTAIVFADSDFIANRLIQNNLNRDMVENSFSWLAADNDLISIRPREPKATKLHMMGADFVTLIVLLFFISVVLFGASIGFWWRRRLA